MYTYTFTETSANITRVVLTSGPDEQQRSKGTKCGSSSALPATFVQGQDSPCWQLMSGKTKADVQAPFQE